MVLDDTADRWADHQYRFIIVVFNATPDVATQTVAGFALERVALHPVLASSSDAVVRTASFESSTGTFTVLARTIAVFTQS